MKDRDAIIVKGLTKKFDNFTAVNNVYFNVKEGEVFGFLGPNGAGKSTLIKMLCGILEPSKGTAIVGGYDVVKMPDMVKRCIGYMSQRFSLYEDITVEQNVDFYGGIYGLKKKELNERKRWIIEMAGLKGKENFLAGELSGGWKQRLALGCAILHKPPILFLDEPTGGVDPVSRRAFWELIYGLSAEGTTIFVTTHYMDEAEHCTTLGLMYNSKLIALGSPTQLKKSLDEYTIYEITTDNLIKVLEILNKYPEIVEASLFGNSLHVTIKKDYDSEKIIREILTKSGISLRSIYEVIPTIEDVFINKIMKEEQKRNGEFTKC